MYTMTSNVNLYTINMGLSEGKHPSQGDCESMVDYILNDLDKELRASLNYQYIEIAPYDDSTNEQEKKIYESRKFQNSNQIAGSIVFLQEIEYHSHIKFNKLLNKTELVQDRYVWAVQTTICNMENPDYYDPISKRHINFNSIYMDETNSKYKYGYEFLPEKERQQLKFNGIIISPHFLMRNRYHDYNKCIIKDSYINIFKTYRSTGFIPLIHKPTNIILYVNSVHPSVSDTTRYNSVAQTCYINDLYNKRFSNLIIAGDWNFNKFRTSINNLYNTPAYHYEDKSDDNYKSLKWMNDMWELFDVSPQKCSKNFCKNKYDYIFPSGVNIYIDNSAKPTEDTSASENLCVPFSNDDIHWDHIPLKKKIRLSLTLHNPKYDLNIVEQTRKVEHINCEQLKKYIFECMHSGIDIFQTYLLPETKNIYNKGFNTFNETQFLVFNPELLANPLVPKIDASHMGDFSAVYDSKYTIPLIDMIPEEYNGAILSNEERIIKTNQIRLNDKLKEMHQRANNIKINCSDKDIYIRIHKTPTPVEQNQKKSVSENKSVAPAPKLNYATAAVATRKGGVFNSIFIRFILQ